jgi:MFS transporter, DHA1 family, tetracycline resistance protein
MDRKQTASAVTVAETGPWWRWIEPWYLAYALRGAVGAGLLPILLPLFVSRTGRAGAAGLVVAAFSLGGLTSPLWGDLADRFRLHRWLLAGGLLTMAIGVALFPLATTAAGWILLALLQGVGAASAVTVANLFVVEVHPRAEWDERIGWLQTFFAGGQVGGLLLAGVMSQVGIDVGMLAGAGLAASGALIGWWTTHTPPRPAEPRPVLLQPDRSGEWAVSTPQRLFHQVNRSALHQLGPALHSPFGLFLVIWLLSFGGAAVFFALYPVLMQKVYALDAGTSSLAFAVAAALGLVLYSPAGRLSERLGPTRVLQAGWVARLLAFLGLLVIGILQVGSGRWLALVCLAIVVLAWSLVSVGGTALAAQLSPIGQGEGQGLFNAATGAAGVLGAALGGWQKRNGATTWHPASRLRASYLDCY